MNKTSKVPQDHILPKLIFVLLIFFGILSESYAQEETTYTTVSLMKVKQGNEGNYISIEREFWKPIHQELVAEGKILGWYLYRIQFTGTGDEYNFVTVTHYRGSENLGGGYSNELFEKIHPNVPLNVILERTQSSRDLVSSRLLEWTLQSIPEGRGEPSKYAVVNYQKSVPGTNYLALRRDYVKPIFDSAIKEGKVEGWGLWSQMFPSGASMPYNWVSADFYDEFKKIGGYGWQDLLRSLNPDKDVDEIMQQLGESRTMVKRELWQLIDYVR
jgi:hypothetical protein